MTYESQMLEWKVDVSLERTSTASTVQCLHAVQQLTCCVTWIKFSGGNLKFCSLKKFGVNETVVWWGNTAHTDLRFSIIEKGGWPSPPALWCSAPWSLQISPAPQAWPSMQKTSFSKLETGSRSRSVKVHNGSKKWKNLKKKKGRQNLLELVSLGKALNHTLNLMVTG